MTVIFALLTAASSAVSVTTQHIASSAGGSHRPKGWAFIWHLFRSPMWLFGWIALAASFLFQSLALHNGQLSVVQPLLVTELIFGLLLRRFWIHQSLKPMAWVSAGVTCVGLAAFLAVGQPEGGNASPISGHWLSAGTFFGLLAVVLTLAAQRGSPSRRAALYACAAAILWSLVATLIKTATEILTQSGLSGLFTDWPVYALALCGGLGVLLEQAALHAGPLRSSQPFLVIVDPLVSIALGVWLFNQRFTGDALTLLLAGGAFGVMCLGAIRLTRSTPLTMAPDSPT